MKEFGENDAGSGKFEAGSQVAKRDRTLRMTDADWRKIRFAAKSDGMTTGEYFKFLSLTKTSQARVRASDLVVYDALVAAMTQFTRAVVEAGKLPDEIFEFMLELHRLLTQVLEAA